ncbi:MAG: hypothetical protein PUC49_09600 [Clostridiales bacterium]|nr:hypothetical protein [Clostridiales bacterium]
MEENSQVTEVPNQKKGLGIAGLILGILSILCCAFCGAGVVFCIIGGIFSIISIVKGTGSGRTLGIVGLVLNILGLLINAVMILSIAMMIDWSKITPENLSTINQIDTNDYNQVEQWVQQFFRMDLTTN